MEKKSRLGGSLILALAFLLWVSPAQTAGKAEILFIQMAKIMELEGHKLTLAGVSSHVVWFTERPSRKTGHMTLDDFLSSWKDGAGSFQNDPPNAVLTLMDLSENPAVLELRNPVPSAAGLTYDIIILEGNLPKSGGPVSLVIDGKIIGIDL